MSLITYDLFVKTFVMIYLQQGDTAAGEYADKNFPNDWKDNLSEWQARIRKEFASRGYDLVDSETEAA